MRTNQFTQRIPGFIDFRDKPLKFDFTTLEELTSHPFIQKWLNRTPPSNLVKEGDLLMIEENEGYNWWAIGWIKNPDDLNLPMWGGAKYIVEFPNGKVELLDRNSLNPVVSSCGNTVTLKDGTICKKVAYEDWKIKCTSSFLYWRNKMKRTLDQLAHSLSG